MATSTFVVDSAFIYITTFAVLLFLAVVFLMVAFLVRYRRSRHPRSTEIPGNALLEVLWIVLPTLLVLTMFFYGLTGFNFLRHPPADSMSVHVVSRQWTWQFVYQNGRQSPALIVPVGRDVRLALTSEDVIHGFFVPAFRIKQDAVPGMTTQAWFNAVTPGTFDILCTQYCGTGHSAMLAKLVAVSPELFDRWYAGENVAIAGLAEVPAGSVGEALLRAQGCQVCHSIDGRRLDGPTFKGLYGSMVAVTTAGARRTVLADGEYIVRAIVDPSADIVVGFPDIMPSYAGRMTEQQIEGIATYLQTLR